MPQTRKYSLTSAGAVASAVLVLALFLFGIGLRPRIENGGHSLARRAKADIARLQQALELYRQQQGCLPPDRPGLVGVKQFTHQYVGSSPELLSNVLLVQYLTTRDSRQVCIELETGELARVGALSHKVANSYLFPPLDGEVPAYAYLDPWGNPYVYDNNEGDIASLPLPRGTEKLAGPPNNNAHFDLYSCGPDGLTAENSGIDGDGDDPARPDDLDPGNDELLLNGRESSPGGGLGDDISNFAELGRRAARSEGYRE